MPTYMLKEGFVEFFRVTLSIGVFDLQRTTYQENAASSSWRPVGPDECADPLRALAQADIPAILLPQSYPPADCQRLMERFGERGLLRAQGDERTRVDIGTSLGNMGADPEAFLAHAEETHALFATLFAGLRDPVQLLYRHLQALAPNKAVKTARERDGRLYGPAIFRIHYESHAYQPHIDHVVLREKRFNFEVARFTHQFAGVLCVQNADSAGLGVQAVLHRCLWTEAIQPYIAAGRFHDYAVAHGVEHCEVALEPGDLYFFNTRCIHEVPAVQGDEPRVVLAVFIGYAEDDEEIYVWS